ncbi:hypothetical protein ACFOET_19605 [Parapedobacter deserti]|uniref:PKD domain-containing protein n=1 Tax=Parapedobacter deserti TaxID=1912957 RepID=A0ABV7JP31_9SPHI
MKTYRIYSLWVMMLALVYSGCEPIEERMAMGGGITADQLNITATPVVVDGQNSNKIVLDNKSPVLSSWDFGVGTTARKTDTVLLVTTGENEIIFTGLNPDGTKITKTLTVRVDELSFEVPLEWGYLTGGTEREWIWDDTQPAVWGNGGYLASTKPEWWMVPIGDINGQAPGEGPGAKMVFSLRGAMLTKVKADGQEEAGFFSFNMARTTTQDDGTIWAKGKLTTRGVTVLCGKSPDEGNAPVYEYDILVLDDDRMVLSYAPPGSGAWDPAFFWVFRAVE